MKTLRVILNCIIFVILTLLISCEKELEGDTTPPQLVSVSPADGATEVSIYTTVTAKFSEPVIVSTSSFYLTEAESSISVEAEISIEKNKVTLTPADSLQYGTEYIAHLSDKVSDVAGNTLKKSHEWSFTTESLPLIVSILPEENAEWVSINTKVIVEFNARYRGFTPTFVSITLAHFSETVEATAYGSWGSYSGEAVLTPVNSLQYNTKYTVYFSCKFSSGEERNYEWSFTTEMSPWELGGGSLNNVKTNRNDEVFITGVWDDDNAYSTYFTAKFNNEGSRQWFKETQGSVSAIEYVASLNVTNEFVYVLRMDGQLDKYTTSGEEMWSVETSVYPKENKGIALSTDGGVYFYSNYDERIVKLGEQGIISEISTTGYSIMDIEDAGGYLLVFGFEGGPALAKLDYNLNWISWGGTMSMYLEDVFGSQYIPDDAYGMEIENDNLFLVGKKDNLLTVFCYELSGNSMSYKWQTTYGRSYENGMRYDRFGDVTTDRNGNFYALVYARERLWGILDDFYYHWEKISPSGEIEIISDSFWAGKYISACIVKIAATCDKVFTAESYGRWDSRLKVFDSETGERIH